MENRVSIAKFRRAIRRLPADEPVDNPKKWYRTQKEHWLGWLGEYHGPGAYGRKSRQKRDAKFAYNHIVCPEMLLYLIKATDFPADVVARAEEAYRSDATMMAKSGAIRKVVPWNVMTQMLWGSDDVR